MTDADDVHALLSRMKLKSAAPDYLKHLTVDHTAGDPEPKRRALRNLKRYVFARVDGVFDDATLAYLRGVYAVAEQRVATLGNTTLADGSYVSRNGRYDVALGLPDAQVSQFVLGAMKKDAGARLRTGIRALVVPRATPEQPWHQDAATRDNEPRYVTLIVALEDMPDDADGATEFKAPLPPTDGLLRGGGDAPFDPERYEQIIQPRLLANQGLLFDGRIVHRGGRATRRRPPVVYLVYTEPELEENV